MRNHYSFAVISIFGLLLLSGCASNQAGRQWSLWSKGFGDGYYDNPISKAQAMVQQGTGFAGSL